MSTSAGIQTNQIVRVGKEMRLQSVTLPPKSVKGIVLLSDVVAPIDPTDEPYVQAGAVSKVWLTTGEVIWVTSTPDELTSVSEWPP